MLSLLDFPHTIEPTVHALEIRSKQRDGSLEQAKGAGDWTTLQRVPVSWCASLQLFLPNGATHLFTDAVEYEKATFVLCYSANGGLTHLLIRGHNMWHVNSLPEEVLGALLAKPSVRLVFADEEARTRFMREFIPEHEDELELAEPPWSLDVLREA